MRAYLGPRFFFGALLAIGIGIFVPVASHSLGWSHTTTLVVAGALLALIGLLGVPLIALPSDSPDALLHTAAPGKTAGEWTGSPETPKDDQEGIAIQVESVRRATTRASQRLLEATVAEYLFHLQATAVENSHIAARDVSAAQVALLSDVLPSFLVHDQQGQLPGLLSWRERSREELNASTVEAEGIRAEFGSDPDRLTENRSNSPLVHPRLAAAGHS
jgi:hypothetical protein